MPRETEGASELSSEGYHLLSLRKRKVPRATFAFRPAANSNTDSVRHRDKSTDLQSPLNSNASSKEHLESATEHFLSDSSAHSRAVSPRSFIHHRPFPSTSEVQTTLQFSIESGDMASGATNIEFVVDDDVGNSRETDQVSPQQTAGGAAQNTTEKDAVLEWKEKCEAILERMRKAEDALDTERITRKKLEAEVMRQEKEFRSKLEAERALNERLVEETKKTTDTTSKRQIADVSNEPRGQVTVIADTVIAPKPFTGRIDDSQETPESWLTYFERYCQHKRLTNEQKLTLLCLLLRSGAADWLSTLSDNQTATYADLRKAFIDNYFQPPELRWKETGQLWSQVMGPTEKVEDFVNRLRKSAKRLGMSSSVLQDAVLHGLDPSLRMYVLNQKPDSLEALVRMAKIAQAVAPPSAEGLSAALIEAMKDSTQANQRQASELKELTKKVAALTEERQDESKFNINAVQGGETSSGNGQPFRRQDTRSTPQSQQKSNYVRNFSNGQGPGGQRSFKAPSQTNRQNGNSSNCNYCGRQHPNKQCMAKNQQCRHCGKLGHYARVCRSAKQE